jgi:branched-chain amino acid transport system ATP-binding protein
VSAAPLLEVTGLTKRFGRLVVVDGLTFAVQPGEALGVVGPNGAGKSTMLDLISGVLVADEGTVTFGGRDITAAGAADRCRAGIGRSYQIPRPFGGMTVFENALVAVTFGAQHRRKDGYAVAAGALDRVGLLGQANRLAGQLRLLDRKRLELARALATGPRLVLLDEIAGGLAEHEVTILLDTIRQLLTEGVAVVWIEHVVHAVLAVADRLLCLAYGRELALGAPASVMASPQVREVYLGGTPESAEGVL